MKPSMKRVACLTDTAWTCALDSCVLTRAVRWLKTLIPSRPSEAALATVSSLHRARLLIRFTPWARPALLSGRRLWKGPAGSLWRAGRAKGVKRRQRLHLGHEGLPGMGKLLVEYAVPHRNRSCAQAGVDLVRPPASAALARADLRQVLQAEERNAGM